MIRKSMLERRALLLAIHLKYVPLVRTEANGYIGTVDRHALTAILTSTSSSAMAERQREVCFVFD